MLAKAAAKVKAAPRRRQSPEVIAGIGALIIQIVKVIRAIRQRKGRGKAATV